MDIPLPFQLADNSHALSQMEAGQVSNGALSLGKADLPLFPYLGASQHTLP
ncbi:hypothetical protein L2D08_12740 [Domibacillus sp. PGB-M46]|uniref:hypothetical protein n=1 Tax=Domibacillus sp. PGB-M46 TaxID=2910255 RepID=UPI001F5A64CA|nr:hypothetical protein [Domibacillus sp. PGB-M46]MCI2255234.1 hypothetical protein [Domibacillus sp. PGB-M46]